MTGRRRALAPFSPGSSLFETRRRRRAAFALRRTEFSFAPPSRALVRDPRRACGFRTGALRADARVPSKRPRTISGPNFPSGRRRVAPEFPFGPASRARRGVLERSKRRVSETRPVVPSSRSGRRPVVEEGGSTRPFRRRVRVLKRKARFLSGKRSRRKAVVRGARKERIRTFFVPRPRRERREREVRRSERRAFRSPSGRSSIAPSEGTDPVDLRDPARAAKGGLALPFVRARRTRAGAPRRRVLPG